MFCPSQTDAAERAVKLMTEYNKRFTHNEDQKQAVFQMVSYYRKKYPSVNTSMSACKTIGFLVNVGPCKPLAWLTVHLTEKTTFNLILFDAFWVFLLIVIFSAEKSNLAILSLNFNKQFTLFMFRIFVRDSTCLDKLIWPFFNFIKVLGRPVEGAAWMPILRAC